MKKAIMTFTFSTLFLISCVENQDAQKKEEQAMIELKLETIKMDSLSNEMEQAQEEIESASNELENILNEL